MRSCLKRFGGKYYLAPKIVKKLPPHRTYVEPYFGTGAVLFAKDPTGVNEIVNDIEEDLTLFWMALQTPAAFARLSNRAIATPFSENAWRHSAAMLQIKAAPWDSDHWRRHPLELGDRAFHYLVHVRQSLGGRQNSFAPLSTARTRKGMNEQAAAWIGCVDGLAGAHARLRGVAVVGGRDALDVIARYDSGDTLHYLDPPYPKDVRVAGGYKHEMDEKAHWKLLDLVKECSGKVALSSYPNEMYDFALKGWNRYEWDLPNNVAHGESKGRETEVLYCNF